MSLALGSRLGPYQVTAKLGEGGMGEVYRATDSRLRREVAIKVLPVAFTADRERLARFEREAQTLAALNHPNIAAIYGVEESDGTRALVMELVEGEDLAARIARGPLPVEEALAIARQIAEALEAAHGQGIVHRDLKPANVKVRADGTVKVLDFGLAKAMEAGGPPPGAGAASAMALAHSPTVTSHGTQLGVILGTAAYMAPEQARGGAVDARSDLWAFGVALHEMLTGRRLFDGETVSDTLAAVLRADVDLAALPPGTPPAVRRLLRRCLERQPRNRLHSAADARIVLDDVLTGRGGDDAIAAPPAAASRAGWRSAVPWAIAALALLAAVAGWLGGGRRQQQGPGADPAATRFAVPPPGPGQMEGYPALSPDGRSLAFCFAPDGGTVRLFLHSFDTGASRELAGTDYAEQPFWSPDGRHLAFFGGGQLRRLEVATGHVEPLAAASDPRGGTWTESGDIWFAPTCCSPLSRVPAAGGEARLFTELDTALGEGTHRFPWALPGGEALLFTVPDGKRPGIWWLSLRTNDRVFVRPEVARPVFDPRGFLLWNRGGTLMSQRFDPRTGSLAGEAVVVDDELGTHADKTAQDLFGAAGGTVALRHATPFQRELRWIDRDGTPGEVVASAASYYDPAMSPDGRRVAVSRSDSPNYFLADVWLFDTTGRDRGLRFSFARGHTPVWSPDGATIYYHSHSQQDGTWRILAKRTDGVGAEQVVHSARQGVWLDDGSPRDPLLVVEGSTREGTYKLWLLPSSGEAVLRPFQHALAGSQTHAAFSPDGRLLAYTSDDGGQPQIYVQHVDGSPGRWQVTSDGGDLAKWRADGRELYYVGYDRVLRAVAIESLEPFAVGATQELFRVRVPQLAITSQYSYYEPSENGRRFLVNSAVEVAADPGISVTIGWSPAESRGEER